MSDWIEQNYHMLQWLGSLSLCMFVFSLLTLALAIICLPQDYFVREQRPECHQRPVPPVLWGLCLLLKNALGCLLILLGLALLVLPGQGLLIDPTHRHFDDQLPWKISTGTPTCEPRCHP